MVEYNKKNCNKKNYGGLSRHFRIFTALLCAVCLCASLSYTATSSAVARGETRTISLRGVHTKDSLTITYKRNGQYDQAALGKINHFMRDWRANEPTKMDPALIDLLWELHAELGSKKPIYLISGYRSSKTNAMLRRIGRGVARRSMHIRGQAADVFFPDVPIKKLRESALLRERGGVGYYPRSGKYGFVHVDTGRVRHWPRMSPTRLAALFKSRGTRHKPGSYANRNRFASHKNFAEIIQPAAGGLNRIPMPRHKPLVTLASLPKKSGMPQSITNQQAIPKPRFKPVLTASVAPAAAPVIRHARPIITASINPSALFARPRVKPATPTIYATIPNAAKPRRSAKGDLRTIHVASLRSSLTAREQIAPGLTINRTRKGNLLMSTHGDTKTAKPIRQIGSLKPTAPQILASFSSLK